MHGESTADGRYVPGRFQRLANRFDEPWMRGVDEADPVWVDRSRFRDDELDHDRAAHLRIIEGVGVLRPHGAQRVLAGPDVHLRGSEDLAILDEPGDFRRRGWRVRRRAVGPGRGLLRPDHDRAAKPFGDLDELRRNGGTRVELDRGDPPWRNPIDVELARAERRAVEDRQWRARAGAAEAKLIPDDASRRNDLDAGNLAEHVRQLARVTLFDVVGGEEMSGADRFSRVESGAPSSQVRAAGDNDRCERDLQPG